MEILVPLGILVFLLINMTYLKSVSNKQNKFHLDYLVLTLLANSLALSVYIIIAIKNYDIKWISLSTFLNMLSWVFFTLHVESSVKGKKSEVSWPYYLLIAFYVLVILMNNLGVFLLGYISPLQEFLLFNVPQIPYFSDQIVVKSTFTFMLLLGLVFGCFRWLKDSYTIKKKKNYLLWVIFYCFIVLSCQFLIVNYYFDFYTPFSNKVFLEVLRIGCILILIFFILNPMIITYIPGVISIFSYSDFTKERNFELIDIYVFRQNGYLKPKFSLKELSKKTQLNESLVRSVIKRETGKNFVDYVNGYRIEKAIVLILDGYLEKFNVKALGAECGFNSHQTFFRAFRKGYGKTPGQFWKDQN